MKIHSNKPVFLSLAAVLLLAGCAGYGKSPSSIPELASPEPVELTEVQLKVIRRDVDPSIKNAVAEGQELDVATAEYSQLQAVRAGEKIHVCGYAKVRNIELEITRKIAFEGELVGSALFVREYIGGDEAQNDFVRDVCRKRGMDLS